ncbi:MAG TPA: Ig-like domain-containing protein [Candidatus Dormibacteraeota bacterium]|nr:Ig-like domain-containing protein [Candidatus Dormibacteraeota bacterium]
MRRLGGGSDGRRVGPQGAPKQARRANAGPFLAAGLTALILLPLTACGGSPPQIVDYSPQRNTTDVSTAAPIRLAFDHDVDQLSVASRLHLSPVTTGQVEWLNGHTLLYHHATLRTATTYEVILDAGYRDPAGNTYTLRHHWSFTTEAPPSLSASAPADGEGSVDPAAYLSLDFSRAMDATSLKSAIAMSPSVPFDVRLDPGDGRRAIIAPSELLAPSTGYRLLVNTAALDSDGNQLGRDEVVRFSTGPLQPLHHWIAFATDSATGSPDGLWIVNEAGFPRQLFDSGGVRSFTWSPNGTSLLIQDQDENWWQYVPGGTTARLSFGATWASALATGMGFVYIDAASKLHRQGADGSDTVIATDVGEAAVAPDGLRVAFIHATSNANQVWGYDVGLRAQYVLVTDSAPVNSVAWNPAGDRIAYLRTGPTGVVLRLRSLTGASATTTLISGDIGAPQWLPDSSHLVFSARSAVGGAALRKAFVINVVSPPSTLSAAIGLPSDPIDVASPVSSPDGHQIAFLSGDQVWLMNADGTRPTPLTKLDPLSFPYSVRALAWTRT